MARVGNKHRTANGKLKIQHSAIPYLRDALIELSRSVDVNAIIPGRITQIRGHGDHGFHMKICHDTATGVKVNAFYGRARQEVYIATSRPDDVRLYLLMLDKKLKK